MRREAELVNLNKMKLTEEQFPGFGKSPILDANDELKRISRARTIQCDEESLRLDDENMDDQYKAILYHILAVDERSKALKRKSGESSQNSDDSIDSVEILDEAECVERRITNPFVSSKKYCQSMEEGSGSSNEHDGFRKQVLDVLQKPYDREEFKGHLEAFKAGRFSVHHPDVKRKLKNYIHKKEKCLNILRGFFFWLQNLTQEGAFKPWKDRECLAVEPSSQ